MKVTIKKLILRNFRGIRNQEIIFTNNITVIKGKNGLGKSSIVDSFLWLCFGKDSEDRKDYHIKTLDPDNNPIRKLDHEVIGLLDVNGKEIELKRVYREKWVTKRGSATEEMTGHETVFFINDVPKQAGEYAAEINNIMPDTLFKIITNPMHFGGIKWTDRRNWLMSMVGEINDYELASQEGQVFTDLLASLGDMSMVEYKKMVAAKKKKLKDELTRIPARIDEQLRSLPEEKDWNAIEKRIDDINSEITRIEQAIEDATRPYAAQSLKMIEDMKAKNNLERFIADREHQAMSKFNQGLQEKDRKIAEAKSQLENIKSQISMAESSKKANLGNIESLKKKVEELRQQWINVNAEQLHIHDDETVCPTCHQELPSEMLAEKQSKMLENFNKQKQNRLTSISAEGKSIAQSIAKIQEEVDKASDSYDDKIKEYQEKLEEAKNIEIKSSGYYLSIDQEYNEAKLKLENWPKQEEVVIPDTSTYKFTKTSLLSELDQLKKDLNTREQIKTGNARIEELKEDEKKYVQQMADMEQMEFAIEEFGRIKSQYIETQVNKMFPKHIRFKMFNEQINGGIEETCEALINGVPFDIANDAARLNAGISIINVLSKYNNVYAPIFVDNAERVIDIQQSDSQMILLYVDKNFETLNIQ